MPRVLIKDITNRLDISTTTVSLVLNSKDKSGSISKDLAEKIRTEAMMQYEQNRKERGRVTCQTDSTRNNLFRL